MRISIIAFATTLLASPALGSLFFKESKADKIKANLESIGYEVLDSAGLVKDSVIESFDAESIKDWLEAHGVTDASKHTLEVAKEHKDWLLEDIKEYASSGEDAASALLNKGKEYYEEKSTAISESVWQKWSDSKLKEFLDARGVEVPQHSTRDQLNALMARTKHKSPITFNDPTGHFWFDGWNREELVNKLKAAGESIEGTRKDLAHRLYNSYKASYEAGKDKGEHAAEKIKEVAGDWKEATADTFHKWTLDDLKEYVSEFGGEISGTKDSLVESCKDHYYYFIHGEAPPKTFVQKVKHHVTDHLHNVRSHITSHLQNVYSGARSYLTKLIGANGVVRTDL